MIDSTPAPASASGPPPPPSPARPARASDAWPMLAPALLLVGVLVAGVVLVARDSFFVLDIATYRLKPEPTLENYVEIAGKPVYATVFWRSLFGAALVTLITLALAFPYAYVMVRTRSAAWRKVLLVSLFLPFFIGQVVRAYGWLVILGKEGLLNDALGAIGLGPYGLLYNYWAVIFGLVQYMLPFATLLLAPAITAIDEEVELASESLGAGWLATFRYVVLPMARPGLIGAGVVVFTLTLTDFATPEILGGGTQDFIASAVYDAFFQYSNPGVGAALSVALTVIGTLIAAGLLALAGPAAIRARDAGGGR